MFLTCFITFYKTKQYDLIQSFKNENCKLHVSSNFVSVVISKGKTFIQRKRKMKSELFIFF